MPDLAEQIEAIVGECCVNLFSDYGVEMIAADAALPANLQFCATVGLTGSHIRGSLLLATTHEPLELAGDEPRILRDWIAELANQMVGRIKNRLIGMGTTIFYSTPVMLRGEHLAPLIHQPPSLLFRANGGVVSVWFDVDVDPALVLAESRDTVAAREGEALLF
jgi:hypothetical protein